MGRLPEKGHGRHLYTCVLTRKKEKGHISLMRRRRGHGAPLARLRDEMDDLFRRFFGAWGDWLKLIKAYPDRFIIGSIRP